MNAITRIIRRVLSKKILFNYTVIKKPHNETLCCCNCKYQVEVYNTCINSLKKPCNCDDSLGFYVCNAFNDDKIAFIVGKHGICELFIEKEKNNVKG